MAGTSRCRCGRRRQGCVSSSLPVAHRRRGRRRIEGFQAICAAPSRRAGVSLATFLRVSAEGRGRRSKTAPFVTEAVPMNPNPFADVVAFVTNPVWTTAVFWLLVLASVVIAVDRVEPPSRAAQLLECRTVGDPPRDGRLLVAAEFVENCAVLHRSPGIRFWRDRPRLLDGA